MVFANVIYLANVTRTGLQKILLTDESVATAKKLNSKHASHTVAYKNQLEIGLLDHPYSDGINNKLK